MFLLFLASLWDHVGIILGSFWHHSGITLASLWHHFGIIWVSFWDHFGILFAFVWGPLFDICLSAFGIAPTEWKLPDGGRSFLLFTKSIDRTIPPDKWIHNSSFSYGVGWRGVGGWYGGVGWSGVRGVGGVGGA